VGLFHTAQSLSVALRGPSDYVLSLFGVGSRTRFQKSFFISESNEGQSQKTKKEEKKGVSFFRIVRNEIKHLIDKE